MKSNIDKDLGKRIFIPVICKNTFLGNDYANTVFIFEWGMK